MDFVSVISKYWSAWNFVMVYTDIYYPYGGRSWQQIIISNAVLLFVVLTSDNEMEI